MRFGFSEDQKLFQATLAELLADECHHEALAAAWETDAGWIPGLWEKLGAMGITGVSVPEPHGGLGDAAGARFPPGFTQGDRPGHRGFPE